MKIEKLRNKNSRKWFLCGLICVVLLIVTVTYTVSRANYRVSNSIELTSGVVKASPYDIKVIAMYIDDVEQEKDTLIPKGDYSINTEKSYCYKDSKSNKDTNARVYTDELGNHVFRGVSKSSKCILYFDKNVGETKTMSELLATHYTGRKTRPEGTFNQIIENNTMGVIYEAEDDYGTTYYFAGNPLDNWVEFGGYYWRIIRINGDGSIRMIYQGRTQDTNGNKLDAQATGEETHIGISVFNPYPNDNKYVGYFYEQDNAHGLKEQSIAYTTLNNWFINSNIKQGTSYFNKIDLNTGFCGDRQNSSGSTNIDNTVGTGITHSYYGAYTRLLPGAQVSTLISPSYNCVNTLDLYTYNKSNKGNKVLANPVGLITADEASYAGFVFVSAYKNYNSYLYTKMSYWTMSPFLYNSQQNGCSEFRVTDNGSLDGNFVIGKYGLRPVINLRSDVEFIGNGTQSNPYKVVS